MDKGVIIYVNDDDIDRGCVNKNFNELSVFDFCIGRNDMIKADMILYTSKKFKNSISLKCRFNLKGL